MTSIPLNEEIIQFLTPRATVSRITHKLLKNANELHASIIWWNNIYKLARKRGSNRNSTSKSLINFGSRDNAYLLTCSSHRYLKKPHVQALSEFCNSLGRNAPVAAKEVSYFGHHIRKSNDMYDQMAKEVLMRGALFWTADALDEFEAWIVAANHRATKRNYNIKRFFSHSRGLTGKRSDERRLEIFLAIKEKARKRKNQRVTKVHCEHTNPVAQLAVETFHEFVTNTADASPVTIARFLFNNIVTVAMTPEEQDVMAIAFGLTRGQKNRPQHNYFNSCWDTKPFKRYEEAKIKIYRIDKEKGHAVPVSYETSTKEIEKWLSNDPFYGEVLGLLSDPAAS